MRSPRLGVGRCWAAECPKMGGERANVCFWDKAKACRQEQGGVCACRSRPTVFFTNDWAERAGSCYVTC
jgi:hypothetical protein